MKRSTFLKKLLLYVICACLLTAVLTSAFFSATGASIVAGRIADEMLPRAESIARLASRYQTGQLSFDSFIDFATKEQRNALIYVFDAQGALVAYSASSSFPSEYRYLATCATGVLQSGEAYVSLDWRSVAGIVVGAPITDNLGRVTGAVMLAKQRNEVSAIMLSLAMTLIFSSGLACIVMMAPALIFSRSISKPIGRMTEIAGKMAGGDFSQRAEEEIPNELGFLGAALNHLSGTLHATIGDLTATKTRLNMILDSLSEGVVAVDENGLVTYHNPAAARLLRCGVSAACVQASVASLLPLCAETVADGRIRSAQELRGDATLLCTASAAQQGEGRPTSAILLLQDITETERLEQTRRDYVANVSHELRTPIASIRSLSEALNDGLVRSEEDCARYYGYILRESLRLSRLINDLLELSRLQSGTVALEKAPFSLAELLADVTERVRMRALDSGITLAPFIDPGLPPAFSNRDRIEQVTVALLDNAIKYASDDGRIELRVDVAERMTVRISNSGHIAEKDLPHLFERFYKADAAHSKGGTGLGLAIVQELMARLGEEISAANDGEDAVLSFTVAIAPETSALPGGED